MQHRRLERQLATGGTGGEDLAGALVRFGESVRILSKRGTREEASSKLPFLPEHVLHCVADVLRAFPDVRAVVDSEALSAAGPDSTSRPAIAQLIERYYPLQLLGTESPDIAAVEYVLKQAKLVHPDTDLSAPVVPPAVNATTTTTTNGDMLSSLGLTSLVRVAGKWRP